MIKFFKPQKKYNIEQSTIQWTFLGTTSNGNQYCTYTLVDEKNWKRKQFKWGELKDMQVKLIKNEN